MSLYNMLMERNPFSRELLGCLGITQQNMDQYPLGRIRDVYTNETADKIFILHRNYGEEGKKYDEAMAKHPSFIRKYNAEEDAPAANRLGDRSYWVYEFAVTTDVAEEVPAFVAHVAENTDTVPPFVRFGQLVQDLKAGKQNAGTKRAMEVGKEIFKPLIDHVESGSREPFEHVTEHPLGGVVIFGIGATPVNEEDKGTDKPASE